MKRRRFAPPGSSIAIMAGIIFLSLIQVPADAHPHLFIEPAVTATQTPDGQAGFNIIWTWDPGWSYNIISNCDRNGDGVFNKEETEFIYEHFFVDLKTFDYFITLFVNGKKIAIDEIENFITRANREQIVSFIFFIPVPFQTLSGSTAKIIFNDDAFTAGFIQDLKVRSNGPFTITDLEKKTIQPFGVQAEFSVMPR